MRHFEQVVLVSEDGRKTIIERRYNTGEVEYWSVMTVGFNNGQHQGNAQVPFQIVTPDAYDIPNGDKLEEEDFDAAMRNAERQAAFDLFDASLKAAEPAAHAHVKEKVEAQYKQQGKIVLANAIPPTVIPVH